MSWQIDLTDEAIAQLRAITDKRVQKTLVKVLAKLKDDPEKQGKPLIDELMGLRSIRAVGQRYRIIYQIQPDVVKVLVIALGLRKEGKKDDIYAQARKLLERLQEDHP